MASATPLMGRSGAASGTDGGVHRSAPASVVAAHGSPPAAILFAHQPVGNPHQGRCRCGIHSSGTSRRRAYPATLGSATE